LSRGQQFAEGRLFVKPQATASFESRFHRSVSVVGFFALFLFVVYAAQARAQSCNNSGSIVQGGSYCISATSASGNNPQMPVLSFGGSGSACETYSYLLELDFAQYGDMYANGESYGAYSSGALAGNVVWIVDWSSNSGDAGQYGEGGNGDLYDIVDDTDYDFVVWGQNPSSSSITSFLNQPGVKPPWWFGHTLTQESGNRQFYPSASQTNGYYGPPIFGQPDGFGLVQFDGSSKANAPLLTDNILWTWTSNLLLGVAVANGFQAQAQSFWNLNWSQWNAWAAQYPQLASAQYPRSLACGPVTISPTGSGNSQYYNLFQITAYNQGSINENNAWASVNPQTGVWTYNSAYATLVCSRPSYTLPN
jgi:hypothetical protein